MPVSATEPYGRKISSPSQHRRTQLQGFHQPNLGGLSMSPPRLLEFGIGHTVYPDMNSRIAFLQRPSPENPGAASVIVRCHDRNRMPVMLLDTGTDGLSFLSSGVHLCASFAKIHEGSS